ncbi:SdiA-regulated family protein [Pedobacter immunditicola]|uniref:SdiA-regulated family protein n=1 Tax=Pedobacter immunditicola TaxID=3133440 RepID=UPI0030A2B135
MKNFYNNYKWLMPAVLGITFFACKPAADKYSWPAGYDFSSPEKFIMPGSLLEISGITFYQGNGKVVYSVQDEEGLLFKQNWGDAKQTNVEFASGGDYEDVAILNETVFILKSSGTILSFPLAETSGQKTKKVKEWKNILPKGEYEGLYADQENQTLYALCKDCNVDKKTKDATGYLLSYEPKSGVLALGGDFKIMGEQVEALGYPIKSGLKAAALAKNPQTGEWYMLSSVHKLLVIANPDWTIKEAHALNPADFLQPEGMAFDNEFNLYISNEGDELSAGNILKFKYTPAK